MAVQELKMRGKLRSHECHSNQDAGTRKKDKARRRKRAPRVETGSGQRNWTGQSSASRRQGDAGGNEGSVGSKVAVNSVDLNLDQASGGPRSQSSGKFQRGCELQMHEAKPTSKEKPGLAVVKCKAYVEADEAQDVRFTAD